MASKCIVQNFKFSAENDTVKGINELRTLQSTKSADNDNVLYEWFRQCLSEVGTVLMEKAKEFPTDLKISFLCEYSEGWLQSLNIG